MFNNIIKRVFGDPDERDVKRLQPIVEEISHLEDEFEKKSVDELRALTEGYRIQIQESVAPLQEELEAARDRWQSEIDAASQMPLRAEVDQLDRKLHAAENEAMEEIIPQAFAAVREAAKRTLGLRHYDRQLMGGVILHRGTIAEMKTGEGKTLAATLPLYLNALTGRGVHLVTVNDYLARRDAGWMGQIFYLLGLSTGFIAQDVSALYDPDYVDPGADQEDERLVHLRPCPRRLAYEADITYGTNTEFGFDYLRDNMATDVNELVQRELNYAIIDEVDNILIDEARTPLIISGPAEESSDEYRRFAKLVRELRLTRNTAEKDAPVNGDYTIEDRTKAITLTERGIELVERELSRQGILDLDAGDSIYDAAHYELTHYMENALKAQFIFQRDKDYIVQNNEVIIVDEFTGRLMSGRRWSEGLHQAVEAKEGVHVQRETVTVGTVTVQNYFRMYHKRAGMTGTAATEKEEFHRIYNLDVAVIPTAKPMIRHDAVDQVYARETGKFKAIVAEIQQLNQSGRPVLVGTTSVETSERLSEFLKKDHIEHKVLNAKEHTREAGVIAQAGRPGTVTIATNMAGRGTDIILGGNPESLAAHEIERKLFNRESLGRVLSLAVDGQLPKAREAARRERGLTDGLIEAGLALQQQYEKAVQEETDRGPSGYRVQLLQARSKLDYDAASEVVRALDGHDTARARALLKDHGESEALVTEIEKRVEEIYEFRRARAGTKSLAAFLTAELFERHYNARAALIRSVLADDIEHARELVKNTPALAEDLIKDIQAVQQRWREDQQRVLQAGGLHILGTERHEARRIDNQLRGRAGRQGDPGSSQFYLSLEDDLMQRFGGDRIRNLAERLGMDDSQPLQVGLIGRSIETAQERVEGYNFDIRKQVLEYDDVVNKQREAIYRQRRAILEGQADLTAQIKQYFYSEIEHIVDRYVVNYDTWMQTQIDQAINDFTSPTTDEVSVEGILRHLQGILPQVQTVDAEQLAGLNARDLGQELSALIEDSRQAHVNLFLLFGDAGRFVDLIPRMPVVWQNREKALSAADMRQSYDAFMHDAVWVYAGATGQLAGAQDEAATEQPDESAAPDGPDGVGELQPAPAGAMSVPVNITVPGEMAQRIDQAFKALPLTSLSAANIERQQKQLWAKLNEVMTWSVVMGWSPMSSDKISELLCRMLDEKMARYERAIGLEQMQTFERWFLLFTIDQNWRHYLTDIDDLRQGIGLEAFGQRDPLIEFKRQGFQMFEELQNTIDRSVVYNFFLQLPHHQTWVEQQQQAREAANRNYRIQQRGKGPSKGMTVQRGTKVGRNELCPCGSGKKYKNCHGRADGAARLSDGQGQGQPNEAAGAKRNGGSQLRRER